MSLKKIAGNWQRKQVKKVVKRAKIPIFKNKVMKGMDNVRGGPRFNLSNRSETRRMDRKSKKKVKGLKT